MNQLIKSKERVSQHGEVFTPKHIVLDMLDLVSEPWSDPEAVFLEPTCGNGNFVVEMFIRRVNKGIDCLDAINSIFGMDIMADNIQECHVRLYKLGKKCLAKKDKDTYRKEAIQFIAIVENNIWHVADSLIELSRTNGDSNFDNKKFVFKDPTGQSQILPEAQSKSITRAISARWRAIEEGIKNTVDYVIQIQKLQEDRAKIESQAVDHVTQGQLQLLFATEDPRVMAINNEIYKIQKQIDEIKPPDDTISVFLN